MPGDTEWKPGQSGNPNGRPKKEWTWRGEIIKALERTTDKGVSMKQGVAEALVERALAGDVAAIKEIGNRADGMPLQAVQSHISGAIEVEIKDFTGETDDNTPTQTEGIDSSE